MIRTTATAVLASVVLLACGSGSGSSSSGLPVISQGERVDLSDHVNPEGYTLFVFGADW